jgi:transcriptional regulator NrdR family protein
MKSKHGGISCPVCDSSERKVLETRKIKNGVARRILCLNCTHRFSTREIVKESTHADAVILFEKLLERTIYLEKNAGALKAILEEQIEAASPK